MVSFCWLRFDCSILVTPFWWLRFGVTRRSVLVTPFWCDRTKSDHQNGTIKTEPPKRSSSPIRTFSSDPKMGAPWGLLRTPMPSTPAHFAICVHSDRRNRSDIVDKSYHQIVKLVSATLNEFSDSAPTTAPFPRHDRPRYGTGQAMESDERDRNGQTRMRMRTAVSVSGLY